MTFFTLLLVVTQAVSIGVVDEPLTLANGMKLMPGDRVLAIHDSTHPWLAFLPSGEFLPLDSSGVVVADEWYVPVVFLRDHPEVDSGLWSAPDRNSGRVSWHSQDQRIYLGTPSGFSYRDSSFWVSEHSGEKTKWFPLTRKEVLGSISGFGQDGDSIRARVLFDLADKLRLDEGEREDTSRNKTVARLYELSLETCSRLGDPERIAEALLTLATFEVGLGEDSVALALYRRSARELDGVKSSFGRTDAYANWQMMELAWRHKDIVQTSSLARKIIVDYPAQMAETRVITWVGDGPSPMYATRSIWFDVSAANRLLETVASDESRLTEAAEFLTESKCLAVRFRGYDKLIALSEKRSDSSTALSYARAALSLPHYTQLEVWPPSACTHPGGRRQHDFKNEFIDSLDVLLPFADLLRLYDTTYNLKDTMMSRDAANWFMRKIERGQAPPRAGILERIDPPRNSAELKRALLASMTDAPKFRTAVECTLFTHRPDAYPGVDRTFTRVLPSGSFVQPYVMREGLVRVATPSGLSGWTNARSLQGAVSLWDISAIEVVTVSEMEPVANADINGDRVRDLELSRMDVLDGKSLVAVRPPDRNVSWLRQIGVFRRKWVELRGDTLWLQGVGTDTIATSVPVARKTKKGVCKPGSCFYFVAEPEPNDSFAWVSAVRERGTVWTTPLPIGTRGADVIYQVDSTLIITGGDSAWLLSAADGSLGGRIATNKSWKAWRGVFFRRSGYAVAKGDSVIYRDYSGSREIAVAVGKSDAKLFPSFAASFETNVWGAGRFGQALCPIEAEAVPFVTLVHRYVGGRSYYDIAMHLIALRDGRELATVSMSEDYYDCHYDEHGIYVSDDAGLRAVTWEGKPLAVADLPLLSYPIWDGDRIVSYFSRPMGTMFEAGAASRLADAVRPLRSRWPAMDSRWESGWRGEGGGIRGGR